MFSITVSTSKEYTVKVGRGLLPQLGPEIAAVVSGRSAVIVSDTNVWPLYGIAAVSTLEDAGFLVKSFLISPGEASKNSEQYLKLLTFLAESHLSRSDCLIALGGGVVGDLTGFTAATYLRGIPYIQVPTTLLAMVDSSVGGKTAIDLPIGKNLVGAFCHPTLVLCDTDTLNTLPQTTFIDGCAEVIKYGILYDIQLFSHLEEYGIHFDTEYVIARCIELKKQAVMEDEFDHGARRKLNLGHTLGHSIESLSNYEITHGAAVSIGMGIISRSAAAHGQCTAADCQRIISLLAHFDLPFSSTYSPKALAQAAYSDKKRSGDQITLVLPATIGCGTLYQIPVKDLEEFITEGM